MKDIYLFRHGQTDFNLEDRFQGHMDIPLNETGRLQALRLKETLLNLNLDMIISSDLARARETAQIATEGSNLCISYSEKLREAHLGEAQGKTKAEIKALWGDDILKDWFRADTDICFPNGESKNEALVRFKKYIEEFISGTDIKRLGISTHGFIIFRVLVAISDVDPKDLTVDNGKLFHIRIDNDNNWEWIQ